MKIYKTNCCNTLALKAGFCSELSCLKECKKKPSTYYKCIKCGGKSNMREVTKEEYKRFSRLYFYQKFFIDDDDLASENLESLYNYYVDEEEHYISFSDMVFYDEDIIHAITDKSITGDVLRDYFDYCLEMSNKPMKKMKNLSEFNNLTE